MEGFFQYRITYQVEPTDPGRNLKPPILHVAFPNLPANRRLSCVRQAAELSGMVRESNVCNSEWSTILGVLRCVNSSV